MTVVASGARPFYHEFAWAYDLLQTDSVAPRVDFIQAVLSRNEITANSTVLDAGCGTGRYATELAKRGFHVFGVDQSAELIAIARNRESDVVERPQFVIADLLVASFPTLFDAILCRGVLNDFVEDGDRRCIFRRFETWLTWRGRLRPRSRPRQNKTSPANCLSPFSASRRFLVRPDNSSTTAPIDARR